MQLAWVVVGEAIAAADASEGLSLAAGTHALPGHAAAAEGADGAAAGLWAQRNHSEFIGSQNHCG